MLRMVAGEFRQWSFDEGKDLQHCKMVSGILEGSHKFHNFGLQVRMHMYRILGREVGARKMWIRAAEVPGSLNRKK